MLLLACFNIYITSRGALPSYFIKKKRNIESAIEATKFSLDELCALLCGYRWCGSKNIARKHHSDHANFVQKVSNKEIASDMRKSDMTVSCDVMKQQPLWP